MIKNKCSWIDSTDSSKLSCSWAASHRSEMWGCRPLWKIVTSFGMSHTGRSQSLSHSIGWALPRLLASDHAHPHNNRTSLLLGCWLLTSRCLLCCCLESVGRISSSIGSRLMKYCCLLTGCLKNNHYSINYTWTPPDFSILRITRYLSLSKKWCIALVWGYLQMQEISIGFIGRYTHYSLVSHWEEYPIVWASWWDGTSF